MNANENSKVTTRFIEFRLGQQLYAIPLLKVREVIPSPKTTPIPKSPHYFRGVTNLRGQIIAIVDLRSKLNIPECTSCTEQVAIIIDLPEVKMGIIVDSINKVLHVTESELGTISSGDYENSHPYILSVINREASDLVVAIDIEKALDSGDFNFLDINEIAS